MERNEDVCKRVRQQQMRRLKKEKRIRCAIIAAVIIIVIAIAAVAAVKLPGSSGDKSKAKNKKTHTAGNIVQTAGDMPQTAGEISDEDNKDDGKKSDTKSASGKFKNVKYPKRADNYTDILSENVLSPYVALVDVNNNEVIAGKSYDARIYPASMTKVMTLIVAVENIKSLDDTFAMTTEMIDPLVRAGASRAGFDPGESVTAKDMLYGLILSSGADAAVGLSNLVAGSEENFVKMMNDKCEEIGLKNTHFMNTSGLHDENHYTTPAEMAMILEYALSNETCAEILGTYQYTTAATPQHPEGLVLSSTLFSRMVGDEVSGVKIIGGKTGYTTEAGNCLVSCAERGNDRYIAVTAGAGNRWNVVFDDFELYGNFIPNPPGYVKQQ